MRADAGRIRPSALETWKMRLARNGLGAVAVMCLGIMAGCGPDRGVVPVEGQIRFAGGPPPGPGYIYFTPLDMQAEETGSEARPATAIFMQDGRFTATTFREGDGLRPGAYEARVECNAATGGHGPVRSAVPEGFRPPRVDVPAAGQKPVWIELDVR